QGNLTNNANVHLLYLASPGDPNFRGSVRLNLTDVDGSPIIDLRYLTHPEDMRVAIDGVELTMKVFENTPQFRRLGARFPPNQFPDCEPFPFRSRSYWECYAKYSSVTYLHASGTCAMGASAASAVGFWYSCLRVVDASIMPLVANSNLQATVYAIAEKASDMILQEYWIDPETAKTVDQRVQKGLFLFACTNSAVNPIVYGIFNMKSIFGRNMAQSRSMRSTMATTPSYRTRRTEFFSQDDGNSLRRSNSFNSSCRVNETRVDITGKQSTPSVINESEGRLESSNMV
ncbi:Glucose dehydrogenase [FAD, quinone], partial [Orchesella cincta]